MAWQNYSLCGWDFGPYWPSIQQIWEQKKRLTSKNC